MKVKFSYAHGSLILHKFIGSRGGGFIHEGETEWCCTKVIQAVKDKQLRISYGGMHLMGDYSGKSYFINNCPFCGVSIRVRNHKLNKYEMEIMTKSALEWKMNNK